MAHVDVALREQEGQLAIQDVERVILAVVDVSLELAPRGNLDDREVEPGRIGGAGEELDVSEHVTAAWRNDDRPRRRFQ